MVRTVQVISCKDGTFAVGDSNDAPDYSKLITVPDLFEGLVMASSMAFRLEGSVPIEIVCGPYKALLQS
jgi:hypothetical protein